MKYFWIGFILLIVLVRQIVPDSVNVLGWFALALVMGVISIGIMPYTWFLPKKKSRQ